MPADNKKSAAVFIRRGFVWMLCFITVITQLSLFTEALEISARSAILIDAQSGSVIYSKDSDRELPMASTTKIMTAIVAIEQVADIHEKIKIPDAAIGVEGSSIYLCKGEVLSLEDLLYALLLASANDAATAIAIHVGGSIEGFAELMNHKARDIGLTRSHFENPHGLDNVEHYTTASDLARLTAYALKNETFKKIVSTKKKTIPFCGEDDRRLLVNHNRLLTSLDGAIGVKTGFTKKSGRCLVSAVERDGTILVAVTLNAPNDWNDHRLMHEYGYENYETVQLEEFSVRLPVISGVRTNVRCGVAEKIYRFMEKEHGEISCTVELYQFAYAPIKKGERLGTVFYTCDGEIIGEADIIAFEAVEKANQEYTIWDKIMDKITK